MLAGAGLAAEIPAAQIGATPRAHLDGGLEHVVHLRQHGRVDHAARPSR